METAELLRIGFPESRNMDPNWFTDTPSVLAACFKCRCSESGSLMVNALIPSVEIGTGDRMDAELFGGVEIGKVECDNAGSP